ncbi:MAG: class I SAM-dependent methyltransferase [Candidatus Cyclonatronum sp.]|uniref:class I SAM-dependent methyltransferase n=1 Tax=Cyclonatronum sp. TaxID=3024185 RepID=UPI0025C55FA7|nr:class I SAM-dependent methyltransferase [Cyclonatronum sp.]MCC5934551.1 class I SAM-dependent methyltransferase [Balneolales bacterium]MCH8485480.1 class I SAM-dependent methyltransferase [Cyclonatronum sp.]
MKQILKAYLRKKLNYDGVVAERNMLRERLAVIDKPDAFAPAGHFYSPYPDLDQIRKDEDRIFSTQKPELPGLELREKAQLELLNELAPYYAEQPFGSEKKNGLRYFFLNEAYSYSDAIFLYSFIRHLKPRKIIEAGCGYSSCVMLDTNELFFGGSIQTTFIEPYPDTLLSLIKEQDKQQIELISSRLQDVDVSVFETLGPNDIFFIDSTHVSKVDSDVNYIFFEILPRLATGVYVHFHDVFFPFEYPKQWIYEGRAWTEAYLLRAFLQYNSAFQVELMNTFMHQLHPEFFEENMPLTLKNTGGSIWIKKL